MQTRLHFVFFFDFRQMRITIYFKSFVCNNNASKLISTKKHVDLKTSDQSI